MPELGPGQLRVKVEACGLCHIDIHAANGDWPIKPSPPFIPGHRISRGKRLACDGRLARACKIGPGHDPLDAYRG